MCLLTYCASALKLGEGREGKCVSVDRFGIVQLIAGEERKLCCRCQRGSEARDLATWLSLELFRDKGWCLADPHNVIEYVNIITIEAFDFN